MARNPGLERGRQGWSEAIGTSGPRRLCADSPRLEREGHRDSSVGTHEGCLLSGILSRYDCLGAGAWGSWSPCPPCPPPSGCSQPGGTATSSRAPHSPAGGKRDLESGRGLLRVSRQLVMGLRCEAMSRVPSTPSCAPPRWPGVGFLTKCFLRTGHRVRYSTQGMPLTPVSSPVQEWRPGLGWQEVP